MHRLAIVPLIALLLTAPHPIRAGADCVLSSDEIGDASRRAHQMSGHGRYEDAVCFSRKALELGERKYGPNHPKVSALLEDLAGIHARRGDHGAAEPLLKRSLGILRNALGRNHDDTVAGIDALAALNRDWGREAAAAGLAKRSLAIREEMLLQALPAGSDEERLEAALKEAMAKAAPGLNLGGKRLAEAVDYYILAARLAGELHGPKHPRTAVVLNYLGLGYWRMRRFEEAERRYRQALDIRRQSLKDDHPDLDVSYINLGLLYRDWGRYAEAGRWYGAHLAFAERRHGPDSPGIAQAATGLADIHYKQGANDRALALLERVRGIHSKAYGSDDPRTLQSVNGIATVYDAMGRFAEAEPRYKRVIAGLEGAAGPARGQMAMVMSNLADMYRAQGRYEDAEGLFKRAIAIVEEVAGREHRFTGAVKNNLTVLYKETGRLDEAAVLYATVSRITAMAYPPGHPFIAVSLNNMAEIDVLRGRLDQAEAPYLRALKIRETAFGPDHRNVANTLAKLAILYRQQERNGEAKNTFERALRVYRGAVEPRHSRVAGVLSEFAEFFRRQGQPSEALAHIRQATDIYRARAERGRGDRTGARTSELRKARDSFVRHVAVALTLAGQPGGADSGLRAEGFEVAQLARRTAAGAAVSGMAARFAAGDDDLAGAVRQRQDAVAAWRQLDQRLLKAAGRAPSARNREAEAADRRTLATLDGKIETLSKRLASEFPRYAELVNPGPVPLADVGELLGPGEALLTYLVSEAETFVWVLSRERSQVFVADVGRRALGDAVTALRGSLDPATVSGIADIPPFDTTRAFALYARIFLPAEAVLEGAHHVFVVPDGALQSLPLGVLVTQKTGAAFTDFSGYAQVPWLARKYALTTLPSVSSLRALRSFARRARAGIPFTGFGDPLLRGPAGTDRGVRLASLYRGTLADVDAVRNLPPLPDTADELRALSAAVKGDAKQLFLGSAASEKTVKGMDLSRSAIVAFATHGLVAGDLNNAEPALVLTPPRTGTALDDGLLTASEVAHLELNADLVILSACNTAAGDGSSGAEGLSGLAKAFFHAGSRALLVSHWPVFSDAAVKLTTRMLQAAAADPALGRAEALRRSMLTLMAGGDAPHYAHPMFWAPFVIVGEGGAD